jgi:hypothetical protein
MMGLAVVVMMEVPSLSHETIPTLQEDIREEGEIFDLLLKRT